MYHPHERVTLDPGPGRTKQSFAEESNINIIMKRYEKTGMLDHLNAHRGDYGDFIGASDYHTSMNLIREAGEMFMEIPAGVRARFGNDPAEFLEFVQDPDNLEEMVKMGLATKNETEAPEAPESPPEPSGPPGGSPAPEAAEGDLPPAPAPG